MGKKPVNPSESCDGAGLEDVPYGTVRGLMVAGLDGPAGLSVDRRGTIGL